MASKDIGNILKEENPWLKLAYRINEDWKSVSCISYSHLVSKSAEWLARRAADDDVYIVCFGIFKADCQKSMMAFSLEITVIRFCRRFNHLITDGSEARSFKAERQSSATCEQIKHNGIFPNYGNQ